MIGSNSIFTVFPYFFQEIILAPVVFEKLVALMFLIILPMM